LLDDRLITLLEVASRDTTSEPEALTALRFFRKGIAGNTDFRALLAAPIRLESSSLAGYKRRVAELEEEVAGLEEEVAGAEIAFEESELEKKALLESNLQLEARLKAAEKKLRETVPLTVVSDGGDPLSFNNFDKAAIKQVGKKWRAVVSSQTKFTYADFRNWEIDGKVPSEAIDIIPTLVASKAPSFRWDDNPDAVRRVFELRDGGTKTRDIAARLTEEFGVDLKPTAVKFCLQMKKAA
jgi:hypothetical protein